MKEKISGVNGNQKNKPAKKYIPLQGRASRITITVISIVLCVIFVPILTCNLIMIIKGAANPDEVPSVFKISPMIIVSGSMEDTLKKGDLIFVEQIETNEIKVGDIIAFFENEFVVTHRVVSVEVAENGDRSFTTKGDNNVSADLVPVLPENIVGKSIGRIGKMGDFAIYLQTPAGMIIFIGAPVLIYLIVITIRREIYVRKKLNEKKEEGNT